MALGNRCYIISSVGETIKRMYNLLKPILLLTIKFIQIHSDVIHIHEIYDYIKVVFGWLQFLLVRFVNYVNDPITVP